MRIFAAKMPSLFCGRIADPFQLCNDFSGRILVNQLLEESKRTPISVVANWDAELNRK
jgi:hypothetical protein